MKLEVSRPGLVELVARQLGNLFQFEPNLEVERLANGVDQALERCEVCFGRTPNKYYRREGDVYFSPWHSGQYSIFLYFLSHAIAKGGGQAASLADRTYYLNKALNGLDLFHQVEMPAVFFLDHPVGSVLGRAVYGECFSFAQHCTVGNNHGRYPTIGRHVTMMSGSKILGNCTIGDYVILSANAYIKDIAVPSYSIVFGSGREAVIKAKEPEYFHSGDRQG